MLKLFFKYWFPVLLYASLIFIVSSIPGDYLPKSLVVSDFFLHILEYLPFGFLVYRAVKNTNNTLLLKKILISVILVILYAASDEFHQSFVSGRYASLIDFFSDGLGAIIGIGIAR